MESIEETDSGDSIRLRPDRHLAPLDYHSRLRIVPNGKALSAVIPMESSVLEPRSADVDARLAAAATMVERSKRYVDAAKDAEALIVKARSNPTPQNTVAARTAIAAQGQVGLEILSAAEQIVAARARESQQDPAEQRAYIANQLEALIEDDEGKDVVLNVARFAALLDEEARFASGAALLDQVVVIERGTVRLRLRAFLIEPGSKPTPVHVVNYDEIDDARPAKGRRVAFRMSQEDQQRVEAGWRFASNATALIRSVKTDARSLRDDATKLAVAVQKELEQLAVPPGWVFSPAVKDAFGRAVAELAVQSRDEAAKLRGQFEAHERTLRELIAAAELVKRSYAKRDLPVLLAALANLRQELLGFAEKAAALPGEVAQATQTLELITSKLAPGDTSAELRKLLPASTSAARDFHSRHLQPILDLAVAIQRAGAQNRLVQLAKSVDSDAVDPRVRALPLDKLVNGSVNLSDTAADRGSKLLVKAELVSGETDQAQVLDSVETTYEIDRFGLNSDFNAGLIFVKRVGEGLPTDRDVNFDPAPSFSWSLHYSGRDAGFWNTVGLGLGLGVTAVQFADGPPQVGLGPELTMFDGILYGGAGWNLQVSEDRAYWYVGIGLLEAAQRATGLE